MRLSAHWPRCDSVRIQDWTKTGFVPEMQFETVLSAPLPTPPLFLATVKKIKTTAARLSVKKKKKCKKFQPQMR